MKRFYLSSLVMAIALVAAIGWVSSEEVKLAAVENLHAVGYFSDSDYAEHSSTIDPARKFFRQVGQGGFGARAAGAAKFVRVGD